MWWKKSSKTENAQSVQAEEVVSITSTPPQVVLFDKQETDTAKITSEMMYRYCSGCGYYKKDVTARYYGDDPDYRYELRWCESLCNDCVTTYISEKPEWVKCNERSRFLYDALLTRRLTKSELKEVMFLGKRILPYHGEKEEFYQAMMVQALLRK